VLDVSRSINARDIEPTGLGVALNERASVTVPLSVNPKRPISNILGALPASHAAGAYESADDGEEPTHGSFLTAAR
jgi:hypothetical protein